MAHDVCVSVRAYGLRNAESQPDFKLRASLYNLNKLKSQINRSNLEYIFCVSATFHIGG